MEVKTTTNYDQFKILNGNRDLDQRHINRLTRAVQLKPNSLQYSPILVNKRMEIIDGQHRFEVSKTLGLPIYYIISDDANMEDVIAMNTNAQNWNAYDFAKSYAAIGRPEYKLYLELKERFDVPHEALIGYMTNGEIKGASRAFKQGRLHVDDLGITVADLIRLCEIAEVYPRAKTRGVGLALRLAMHTPNYDHRRMLRKMEERAWAIPPVGTISGNLRELENVYNHSYSDASRVRFDLVRRNVPNRQALVPAQ